MRPGRSVTITSPSGRKSSPQGCSSPSVDDIGLNRDGFGVEDRLSAMRRYRRWHAAAMTTEASVGQISVSLAHATTR